MSVIACCKHCCTTIDLGEDGKWRHRVWESVFVDAYPPHEPEPSKKWPPMNSGLTIEETWERIRGEK